MLFNSYPFLFIYLPVTAVIFFLLARKSEFYAAAWLTLASLVFYGYWNPFYLPLLLASIGVNFAVGSKISYHRDKAHQKSKYWLIFGVSANLALLGYYKYAGFIFENINWLFDSRYTLPEILLPLGISFFTFTQIAFLADVYKGAVKEYRPLHYALFVTYFPHLIAGPVLHHKEMMPQFSSPRIYRIDWANISAGLTLFFLGLSKKVIVADEIAKYARPAFDAVAHNKPLTLLESWGGSLAYTFQIYFDFSAYSDMAIGLSLLFGVSLPINFNSPYKARNIIDFWRRWHMTLSRFLRDYLYIPLGGNRRGTFRRHTNLMATMLLGGMWHGANWTFIVWGGLHGLYLLINHVWRESPMGGFFREKCPHVLQHAIAIPLTFIAVAIAWVFFRSDSIAAAKLMLEGMFARHGVIFPLKWLTFCRGGLGDWLTGHGVIFADIPGFIFDKGKQPLRLLICLLLVWCIPNTQQVMGGFYNPPDSSARTGTTSWWQWRPGIIWLTIILSVAITSILSLNEISEFIYFQF